MMRKLLSFISPAGLFLLVAVLALGLPACQKTDDPGAPPTISSIRAYLAAPNDSLLKKVGPGMAVAILGTNLKTTRQVFFRLVPGHLQQRPVCRQQHCGEYPGRYSVCHPAPRPVQQSAGGDGQR